MYVKLLGKFLKKIVAKISKMVVFDCSNVKENPLDYKLTLIL
jgi:hypothetical protein